jgi:hypothetical protein
MFYERGGIKNRHAFLILGFFHNSVSTTITACTKNHSFLLRHSTFQRTVMTYHRAGWFEPSTVLCSLYSPVVPAKQLQFLLNQPADYLPILGYFRISFASSFVSCISEYC